MGFLDSYRIEIAEFLRETGYLAVQRESEKKDRITYSIIQGETLWEIASRIYNDPYAWKILVHDNPEVCIKPNQISIDQELIIRSEI